MKGDVFSSVNSATTAQNVKTRSKPMLKPGIKIVLLIMDTDAH